ncbi:hypothetical protein D3C80_1491200 [compost metagenome]
MPRFGAMLAALLVVLEKTRGMPLREWVFCREFSPNILLFIVKSPTVAFLYCSPLSLCRQIACRQTGPLTRWRPARQRIQPIGGTRPARMVISNNKMRLYFYASRQPSFSR